MICFSLVTFSHISPMARVAGWWGVLPTPLERQIIHVGIHAKICSCRKGHHKHGCKANLERTAVIGNEGKYLDMAMEEISSDGGPTITAVTLDGDSNAIKVAKEKGATVYYCTKHLTKNNAKHIKNEKFSDSMFPSWTKADKKKFQDRFGLDLAQRCQAELQGVCNVYPGDLTAIMKNTEPVAEAVYKCYTGNHSLCHKHSFVCTIDKPWQRGFLQATGRHKQPTGTFITPTDSDLQKLYKLIHERFGQDQLTKTYLNTTTQKCEASNRGLSRSLPKHKEFTRTAPGRAHAAVYSISNLHGCSLTTLAKVAGAPISRKSKVSHQLKNQDKEQSSATINSLNEGDTLNAMENRACYHCGQVGHLKPDCPRRMSGMAPAKGIGNDHEASTTGTSVNQVDKTIETVGNQRRRFIQAKLEAAQFTNKLRQLSARSASFHGQLKPLLGMGTTELLSVTGNLSGFYLPSSSAHTNQRPDVCAQSVRLLHR